MKKYLLITIFGLLLFAGQSDAATFYIDTSCNTPGNGTSPTCAAGANDPYDNVDDFTDAARTAGDKAIMRRGIASSSADGTDVVFTTDGNLNNPITLEADYDNIWGDFASSSQTYTVVRGSKSMTASDTISDIAAGDWIYVYSDKTRRRDFAYEVATVSGALLTLYLPYKGDNTGAGLTLTVMPDAPIWGTTTGDFQWNLSTDDYWRVQGLDIRGTDAGCNISMGSSKHFIILDFIIQSDATTSCGIGNLDGGQAVYKTRIFSPTTGGFDNTRGGYVKDFIIDCNSIASSVGYDVQSTSPPTQLSDGEIKNCISAITFSGNNDNDRMDFRNVIMNGVYTNNSGNGVLLTYFEDKFSIIGSSSQMYGLTNAVGVVNTMERNTATVRNVGGVSTKVYPPSGTGNTGVSSASFPYTYLKLFEYPIYLNTSQTTLTTYFKPDNTASWGTDPKAINLWVEIDVLASASKAFRYTKRSTAELNFNGSSDWQAIPLTVTASQSGNAYIRAWYGKTLETIGANSADNNRFYVDTKIDITQP